MWVTANGDTASRLAARLLQGTSGFRAASSVGSGLEMMIHLRAQSPLGQRLLQRVQQTILVERDLRVGAGQQLVEPCLRDDKLFAPCHTMLPSFPSS